MVENFETLFQEASLSMAAYAHNLSATMDTASYVDALTQTAGMSVSQANQFANRYSVVAQVEGLESGFSATFFRDKQTGQLHLAIRGTELLDAGDLITDFESILVSGIPYSKQYFDLVAFYQSLVNSGEIDTTESLFVSGHSLGGFLAQAFAADFSRQVSQTYTYNAPGIGGFVAQIEELLGITEPSVVDPNITNVIAENLIGTFGKLVGQEEDVFIEEGSVLSNHRIATVTDSLAVYNLLGTIQDNLEKDVATKILSSASNIAGESLEAVVTAIGKLPNPSFSEASQLPNVNIPIGDRDLLYSNMDAIQNNITQISGHENFIITSLANNVATEGVTLVLNNLNQRGQCRLIFDRKISAAIQERI